MNQDKYGKLLGFATAIVVIIAIYSVVNLLNPQRKKKYSRPKGLTYQGVIGGLTQITQPEAPIIPSPAPMTVAPVAPITVTPAAPTTETPVTAVTTTGVSNTGLISYSDIDVHEAFVGTLPKRDDKDKKSKIRIVDGITSKQDNFFGAGDVAGTTASATEYTPDLFQKVLFKQEIKTFNPNFTSIMSMVPDLYKNNKFEKPAYEPVLINDVDGSYFDKDTINLNQDSQYINSIYNEIANDTDNQYFEGSYDLVTPKTRMT